jgi:hypothetical protein
MTDSSLPNRKRVYALTGTTLGRSQLVRLGMFAFSLPERRVEARRSGVPCRTPRSSARLGTPRPDKEKTGGSRNRDCTSVITLQLQIKTVDQRD